MAKSYRKKRGKRSVNKGIPYGTTSWVKKTAKTTQGRSRRCDKDAGSRNEREALNGRVLF